MNLGNHKERLQKYLSMNYFLLAPRFQVKMELGFTSRCS